MLKFASRFTIVCGLFALCTQSVQAEKYVTRAYHVPARIQPVVVAPGVPVLQRPVVLTNYYAPVPVVVHRPVVVTPAPVVVPAAAVPAAVVVPRRRAIHETVRVKPNRTVVRVREYAPLAIFPTSKQVVIQRETPRGVITRQRGR
ncbi:hypothetical protein [Thalassoglobus polymorphus]|uniref:Uncharacterized protein n=1 Tax=Thalassoglobus polymorphus TaxID=2527994 RepID=A0A517QIQ3_9PLAN|nr:hypothetical protein [Thalassoglobus polymorphus]QDT31533.1 hypothetical protein Mal48_07670 [Thalassoglobus polymorphus]